MELRLRPATQEELNRPLRIRTSGQEYKKVVDELVRTGEALTVEVPKDRKTPTIYWGIRQTLKKRGLIDEWEITIDKIKNLVIIKPSTISSSIKRFSFPVRKSYSPTKWSFIPVPKAYQYNFPDPNKNFILETNIGELRGHMASGKISVMKEWHKRNNMKNGDVIEFTVIEDKKQYRLDLIKGEKVE